MSEENNDGVTVKRSVEPLAAIFAEMRDGIHTGRADIIDAVNERLRSYADRLETATKRERDLLDEARKAARDTAEQYRKLYAEKREADNRLVELEERHSIILPQRPVNAAALREALEQAKRDHWFDMSPDLRNKIFAALAAPPEPPSNAAVLREAVRAIKDVNDYRPHDAAGYEINDIIEEALAVPARNCDRYTTAKDALDAFIREKEIKSADVDNMNLRDFFDWLFATAKGGAV